jgi:hypothetical protein
MTLILGNRSGRWATSLIARYSFTLRLPSNSSGASRCSGPERREPALGALYLTFALLWVPFIVKEPLVYDRWGDFFEQFSLVSGALIVLRVVESK